MASLKSRLRTGLRRIQQSGLFLDTASGLTARHIRTVYQTSRIIREPADMDAVLRSSHPCIVCMWHGQFLMVPAIRPDGIPVRNIAARHADGEMVARTLRRFGMELIRGAGAGVKGKDKGGASALRAAVKSLRDGYSVALTADIPPGPARTAGLGIVTMARLSGRPILPVAIATTRFITLPTWSRFTVNLPFSRLAIVVGPPVIVPRDADGAMMEAFRQQVEDAMNAVTHRAYELAGSNAGRVLPHTAKAAPPPKNGLLLGLYRGLTRAARPAAGLILARRAGKGKEVPERLPERRGHGRIPRPEGPLWWFHAASVGETNAVLPLIAALRDRYPQLNIMLTTVTVTSAQIAEARLPEGAIHQFVPLDSPVFVRRFLAHWEPDLGLLTESEIWPNLIVEAADAGVPLVLLNARMSPRSHRRWSRLRSLSRPLFSRFDLVLAQDATVARRLYQLGARNTVVAGNLKYDAPPPPYDPAELAALRSAAAGRPVFLAASTHPGEDEIVRDAHLRVRGELPGLLTIIAPRHPERGEPILRLMREAGLAAGLRSRGEAITGEIEIYIADTIGELGLFYALAPLAFIGGSLVKHGGQNPLEAARLGSSVLTGPHVFNFAETYEQLSGGGACRLVSAADEMAAAVTELLGNPAALEEMNQRARLVVDGLGGALDKTLKALEAYAPGHDGPMREPGPSGRQFSPDYAA